MSILPCCICTTHLSYENITSSMCSLKSFQISISGISYYIYLQGLIRICKTYSDQWYQTCKIIQYWLFGMHLGMLCPIEQNSKGLGNPGDHGLHSMTLSFIRRGWPAAIAIHPYYWRLTPNQKCWFIIMLSWGLGYSSEPYMCVHMFLIHDQVKMRIMLCQ